MHYDNDILAVESDGRADRGEKYSRPSAQVVEKDLSVVVKSVVA
jgi:hypothetical protein